MATGASSSGSTWPSPLHGLARDPFFFVGMKFMSHTKILEGFSSISPTHISLRGVLLDTPLKVALNGTNDAPGGLTLRRCSFNISDLRMICLHAWTPMLLLVQLMPWQSFETVFAHRVGLLFSELGLIPFSYVFHSRVTTIRAQSPPGMHRTALSTPSTTWPFPGVGSPAVICRRSWRTLTWPICPLTTLQLLQN